MDAATIEPEDRPPTPEVLKTLVENHRDFLAFLERRVESRAAAEDILQEAFVRGIARAGSVRDDAAVVPWFYQLLRNAVIDHYRRRASANRKLEAFAHELEHEEPTEETHDAVCKCVARLASTLKPEYAEAIQRIELDGVAVKDFATEVGITPSNAGVRVFRAREALRKQVTRSCGTCADHGCFECSCGGGAGHSS